MNELHVRLIHPFGKPELAIQAYPAGNPEGNTYRTQSIRYGTDKPERLTVTSTVKWQKMFTSIEMECRQERSSMKGLKAF